MAKSAILNSVEEVIEDFRNGRIVIVVDDEDRENEGDFIVAAEKITPETVAEKLGKMSGILVAPGFGNRGIEGKIEAVRFARENNIPFLGICLGMQCAVIEFARHVLNLADANSSEMEQTPHPVIDLMEEQKGVTAKGGTMRLGAYPCALKKGSKVAAAYGKLNISERHRHRYEFNNDYLEQFEACLLYTSPSPRD